MAVDKYPKVHDEWTTLRKLQEGFSIARFGDGELKMATGHEYRREPANRAMAKELMSILTKPNKNCLVGIWPLNPESPKHKSLVRHKERFKAVLSPDVEYYSSLISRPDSAPWIRNREYALEFRKLWDGKYITVLCEPDSGALRALSDQLGVAHFPCPFTKAYAQIADFEERIARNKPDIAILACGPTATCLAHRLAKRGIQAIDFGSAGSFIAKLLKDDDA